MDMGTIPSQMSLYSAVRHEGCPVQGRPGLVIFSHQKIVHAKNFRATQPPQSSTEPTDIKYLTGTKFLVAVTSKSGPNQTISRLDSTLTCILHYIRKEVLFIVLLQYLGCHIVVAET
jgi:hypothetical protein